MGTKVETSTSTSTLFHKTIGYNRLARKIAIANLGGSVKRKINWKEKKDVEVEMCVEVIFLASRLKGNERSCQAKATCTVHSFAVHNTANGMHTTSPKPAKS